MVAWEERAESFATEMTRERYLVGSGRKERLELDPIYQRYGGLFSENEVRERLSRRHESPPASRYLAEFVAGGYLGNRVKGLTQRATNAMLAATVRWDGEDIPYQQVWVLLANEPDWHRRHSLDRLALEVARGINPHRKERLLRLHQEVQALGFDGYVHLYRDLLGVDFDDLSSNLDLFLEGTEECYGSQLHDLLERMGVPPEEATPADLQYLLRGKEYDRYFSSRGMVPALARTSQAMGLGRGDDFPFALDLEPRPRKSPRAFCAPVRIPEEVYLVIKPQGGREDWEAFFHEAGHAEHFSHIDARLPFPLRVLGDNDLIEVYSFHMQYRLTEPSFLRDIVGMPSDEIQPYLRLARFGKLFLLRRYVAKLRYELTLHRQGPEEAPQAYRDTLGSILGIRIAPERYLEDVDDGFYSAQYLRAWMFEAMLREFLRHELGERWWANPDSGDLLYQWWRRGQSKPLDDLLPEIGAEHLSADALLRDVME